MSPDLNRRAMLAGTAAMGVPELLPYARKAASVDADNELLTLGRQWAGAVRDSEAHNALVVSLPMEELASASLEADGDAVFQRLCSLADAIAEQPATTFNGLAVKAAVVRGEFYDGDTLAADCGRGPDRALSTLLADIDRLARADSSAVAVAAAENDMVDAELLALAPVWRKAEARQQEVEERQSDAEAHYERAPEPEALYERPEDHAIFGYHIGRYDRWKGSPVGRLVIYERQLASFEKMIPHLRTLEEHVEPGRYDRQIARMQEILDTVAAWRAENKRRWHAAGVDTASEAVDAIARETKDLRLRIAQTTARTSEGLAFKTEVLMSCWDDEHEEELAYRIKAGEGSDESLVYSLARDIIRSKVATRPLPFATASA